MIEEILGSNGAKFIIAAGVVALGLVCLVAVLWVLRNRPSSPFIRGGKNRQPRLAVLDAAAVDARRRLVLVRRDEVEHLIMIGGPTDIVIESRIAAELPAPHLDAVAPPRPVERRQPAPAPETRPAPVSAMGQVLYGEGLNGPAPQAARPQQPIPSRPPVEGATASPRPAERTPPIQPQPLRQPPVLPDGGNSLWTTEPARTPEDILDAARMRVLTSTGAGPQPVPALPVQPAASVPPAQVQGQRMNSNEFERMLDAEISGDLSRLTAGPEIRAENEPRPGVGEVSSGRQEPRLGTVLPAQRTEPTLEDEMNRMLGEIAVGRKN